MRFNERNDLANRCKEWMKDQLENNITTPLDTVHMVLAYLDVNGYLNKVVRCEYCIYYDSFLCGRFGRTFSELDDYCKYGERKEDVRLDNES